MRSRPLAEIIKDLQKIPMKELYRFVVDAELFSREGEFGWYGYASREAESIPALFRTLRSVSWTDLANLEKV